MQSRRNEDRTIVPDPKLKLRDRGIEMGHARDLYDMPRGDFDRRNLSPRKGEGSRRILDVDGRNSSLERRDIGWDFGGGGRGERVRSRSPPFGLMRERRGFDDMFYPIRDFANEESKQRYEFVDRVDLDADANTGLKHERRHEARLIREEDFAGSRFAGQKFMGSEEMFGLPQDLGTTSKYGEGGRGFSSSLGNMNTGQFRDKRVCYPEIPEPLVDKVSVMESYRGREKPTLYSRDVMYDEMSQAKDYIGSSSGISRAYFEGSCQDDMPSVTDSGKSAKLTKTFGLSSYSQMSSLESGRDPNMKNEDISRYRWDKFSPTRAEREDYLKPMSREGDSDIYGPLSDNLYRRMGTRERVDYDQNVFLRPVMRDLVLDAVGNTDYNSRNFKDRSFLDHPSIQTQKVPTYFDVSASRVQEYFGYKSAHAEYGKVSQVREPHLGVPKDRKASQLRSDFGFGRDAGPTSHCQRVRNSPEFEYDRSFKVQGDEHDIYDSSDRRKYNPDAEMSRHNPRGIISDKGYRNSRVRHLDDWSGHDSSNKFSSRSGGYDNERHPREEREFVEEDRYRFSESEDWLPSDDYMEHVQEHSIKPYKSGAKYSKGHLRHGQQSSHISSRLDRRCVLAKPRNVWIRGQDDNQLDKHENEVDHADDWMNSSKPEPREGSEEFKQLVQNAFLIFSKKLNENPAARKRYKEQGRAGSLFCIVCGRRSVSFL